MKRILAVLVIGLSLVMGTVSGALASDDSARANSLFVEAVQLIQSSQNTLNDKEKLEQLDNALGKLNRIIDRYPSSDLAVKLITGQSIGNINLKTVAKTAEKLRGNTSRIVTGHLQRIVFSLLPYLKQRRLKCFGRSCRWFHMLIATGESW